MLIKKYKIYLFVIVTFISSCSTKKNTVLTRNYHNLTAHYNVYFNGKESFKTGIQKIDNDYKENYSVDIIPVFKYYYDDAIRIVSSDMDKTLQKMSKTISNHSITSKPKIKGTVTPKDREMQKKNEYCKWIDDAYLLIGKANFYKNDYNKAINSFRYIVNYFPKTENTYFEAKLWIAKTYIMQKRYKDSYTYLSELESDIRFPKGLTGELLLTFADYFISQADYMNGISNIEKSFSFIHSKKQKSRLFFLISQLYLKIDKKDIANNYLQKVINLNADYDITFRAKILKAISITSNQNNKELKNEFFKFLKDQKNEEYKDQIYYALASIEYSEKNVLKAIEYYQLSIKSSVNNKNQKILSMLQLANIFYDKKKYYEASQYYDSIMISIPDDYKNIEQIKIKAQNTNLLSQYINQIKLQDSLQYLAALPEGRRLQIIDSIILSIVNKEKQTLQNNQQNYDQFDIMNNQNQQQNNGDKWYMYNTILISRGQQEFKKKWGVRKLEDNWRRSNKSSIVQINNNDQKNEEDSNKVSDNKKREFYLQNLPFLPKQKQKSDSLIELSYYNLGVVYSNNLLEFEMSNETFEKLLNRFPSSSYKPDVYFKLYNNYVKLNNQQKANYYKELLAIQYPESNYSKILQNPNYLKQIKTLEEKAFDHFDMILSVYEQNKYIETIDLCDKGINDFPGTSIQPNFYFLKAKAFGNLGNRDSLFFYLNYIIKKFPYTNVFDLSSEIIKMASQPKYDFEMYKNYFQENHLIVLIMQNSVNTNEFRFFLKNEAENFSNTKSFSIDTLNFDNRNSIITIKTFDDKNEAMKFYNQFVSKKNIVDMKEKGMICFVFSYTNFQKFLSDKYIEKYDIYFKKNYINN